MKPTPLRRPFASGAARSAPALILGTAALTLAAALPAAAAPPPVRIYEGLFVEVEGDWKEPRGLVADELDIRPGRRDRDIELIGPLDTVSGDGTTVSILGISVPLSDGADLPPGELRPGDWVEIDGTATAGGLQVRRLRHLDGPANDVEIEGPVTAYEPGERHFYIAGVRVALSHDTEVRGAVRELVPVAIDDDDDFSRSRWRLLDDRVRAGGRLQTKYEPEENFDLNETRAGDYSETSWFGELQAEARMDPRVDVVAKAGFRGVNVVKDEEGDETDQFDWRLAQAYVVWKSAGTLPWALQIGRQDFDEAREWLYDENLDGVRLHILVDRLKAEASVSTRYDTRSPRLRDWTNWILMTEWEAADRWTTGAYVIHRRLDGDPGNRPSWLGLRSEGRLASGLRHWVDLAWLRGDLDGVTRQAWGADLGVRVRLHRDTRTYATLGFATGSGSRDDAGVFRQTGLQDNNDKFGGVSSFRYYGELLEPELSNLTVATAGVGFRPRRSSSVDLVVHSYRQRTARDRIQGSNLQTRPRGTDPDIGREWNLIVAFEEIEAIDVEYVFAWFRPGDAFATSATDARFHKLQIQFSF